MNIGACLKPVLRDVWIPQGEQPIANGVFWRFQWLWLYGFVHPESGQTKRVDSEAESPGRVLCPANPRPKVNIKLFTRVLADFALHFGAGKNKRIVLALDQAGWHTSEQVEIPEGIHKRVYAFPLSRTTTLQFGCGL